MARSIDDILAEAGEIIEKRAAEGISKTAAAKQDVVGDDVFKLAEAIRRGPTVDIPTSAINTVGEKVAHAIALVETVINRDAMGKLAQFEAGCRERGMSDEQISGYLEKKASAFQFRSVFDLLFGAAG